MNEKTKEFENLLVQSELKRIADILEEILRLVKKDMEDK
jgi:Na+/phosphate symporter